MLLVAAPTDKNENKVLQYSEEVQIWIRLVLELACRDGQINEWVRGKN